MRYVQGRRERYILIAISLPSHRIAMQVVRTRGLVLRHQSRK